jgi:integrase
MKTRLVDKKLRSLMKPECDCELMDTEATAFGVRVRSGKVNFILYRRFPGSTKPTRRTLGRYPDMSLSEARNLAHDWNTKIRKGIDPSAEAEQARKANIEADAVRRANSVAAALDAYLDAKSHLRTARAMAIELRRELKSWLDRPIQDIDKRAVQTLIRGIQARGAEGQARAVYTLLRTFFNWAVKNDFIEVSPCVKIDVETLVGQKKEIDRTLDDYELRALWRATEALGYPAGSFFRLLLLTGLRRREASNASWLEFDLAAGRWIVPATRMKARPGKAKDHLVPIAPKIRSLLEALPRHVGGEFLFSYSGGREPIKAFSKLKAALDKAMRAELAKEGREFKSFVIHDLRRSVRTRLSSLGVAMHICERVLAHAQPELQSRYDKHGFEKEKLDALVTWHAALETIIRPPLRAVA